MSNLLEVRGLSVDFMTAAGPVHALREVDLDVPRGRILGIVGESGSGKTILSRSIMGLLPHRGVTRSGSIRFEGIELVGRPRSAMRGLWGKEMAMIFQDPMTSLNPYLSIARQMTEVLREHKGIGDAEAEMIPQRDQPLGRRQRIVRHWFILLFAGGTSLR